MNEQKFWYWHVDIKDSKASRLRLVDAMFATGSSLIAKRRSCLKMGNGIMLVAEIPDGKEEKFYEIARPWSMTPPLRVHVGTSPPPPDDGHPGRRKKMGERR